MGEMIYTPSQVAPIFQLRKNFTSQVAHFTSEKLKNNVIDSAIRRGIGASKKKDHVAHSLYLT